MPKVSIITVVYNAVDILEHTILSVVNQRFQDVEYIIIDGDSTDGTLQIIDKYSKDIHRIISEKDKGIYDAMNKGLHIAQGDYVLFLNARDELNDEHVLEHIFSTTESDVYYGETFLMNSERKVLGTRTTLSTRKLPESLHWKNMINGMVVSHQSIIVKRELAPYYEQQYKCSADIEWVITALKRAKKVTNVHTVISKYLIGGYSIANQKQCLKERYKIYVRHFGLFNTFLAHVKIIVKNVIMKLKRQENY